MFDIYYFSVSARSTTSKSRIPRSVSRQGSITSERSLASARGSVSGSRLPRPGPSPDHKPKNPGKPKRKDSWDSVASTPRGSAAPTPTQSAKSTPRDGKRATPREEPVPTPRGSILSALDVSICCV